MFHRLRSALLIPLGLVSLAVVGVAQAQPKLPVPQMPPPLGRPHPQAPPIPPPLPDTPRAALPTIDAKAAVKDLLPAAPKAGRPPVYTGDDLRRVPEIQFEAPPEGELTADQWDKRKAFTVAAALHLNGRAEDGFLKALVKERDDLRGLPFVMGDRCRTKGTRAGAFKEAGAEAHPLSSGKLGAHLLRARQAADSKLKAEAVLKAHLDVVRQVAAPAADKEGKAAVEFLVGVHRREATAELARLAVYSLDGATRKAALEALAVRRESDSTAVLVAALRHPWPQVARNAALAIVKLERKDLLPHLVGLLDEKDPRGPREVEESGKKVTVAHELVRINHHRNCMLCHAPAERGKVPAEALLAEIPLPTGQPNGVTGAYGAPPPQSNLLVRIDVTYLRQDFSVMQDVDDRSAFGPSQRFDFVVRRRVLTEAEAKELRKRLEERGPGVLSPYQKAAVTALREMTGRDLEAKAEVWGKFLKLKPS